MDIFHELQHLNLLIAEIMIFFVGFQVDLKLVSASLHALDRFPMVEGCIGVLVVIVSLLPEAPKE